MMEFTEWLATAKLEAVHKFHARLGELVDDEAAAVLCYGTDHSFFMTIREDGRIHLFIERDEWICDPAEQPELLREMQWRLWEFAEVEMSDSPDFLKSRGARDIEARAVMDAFSPPGTSRMSLDEWLYEFGDDLPLHVVKIADEIMHRETVL